MFKRLNNLKEKLFSSKYLLLTNITIGSNLLTGADLVQQKIEHVFQSNSSNIQIDTLRTYSMFKTGACFGVVGHYWYRFLDSKFNGPSFQMIRKKLLCEIIAGPPFAFFFIGLVGYFEKKTTSQSWLNFKQNIFFICLADWFFYVPLQAFNFYFLLPKFRFLFVCAITFIYDIFLSYILHRNDALKS